MEITVLSQNVESFLGKLDKLNRKIGSEFFCPELIREYEEEIVVESTFFSEIKEVFSFTVIEIGDNTTWKLGDYNLIAYYETIVETGSQTVTNFSSEEIPAEYLTVEPNTCEHCNITRQRRKQFLLEKDGEYFVVGSTCVRDYTGHSIAIIAGYLSLINNIEAPMPGGGQIVYPLEYIIFLALIDSDVHGYTSGKQAWDTNSGSTSDDVKTFLAKPKLVNTFIDDHNIDREEVQERSKILLKEATAFLAEKELNEYLVNIQSIINANGIVFKQVGLAVSIVQFVSKEKAYNAEQATKQVSTGFFGELKQRFSKANRKKGFAPIILTVVRSMTLRSELYGDSEMFFSFNSDSGEAIIFKIPHNKWEIIEQFKNSIGTAECQVEGTVVEHSDQYQNTRMNRVNLLKVIED